MKPGTGNKSGYDANKPRYVVLNATWTLIAPAMQREAILESFLKMRVLKMAFWYYAPGPGAGPLVEIFVSKDLLHTLPIFYQLDPPAGLGFWRLFDKAPTVANYDLVEDDALYITVANGTIMQLENLGVSILAQVMD